MSQMNIIKKINLVLVLSTDWFVFLSAGVVPEFLIASVPAMLGCEAGVFSPSDAVEEGNTPSGTKKCRRSLGGEICV